jgi:hypothetical protein
MPQVNQLPEVKFAGDTQEAVGGLDSTLAAGTPLQTMQLLRNLQAIYTSLEDIKDRLNREFQVFLSDSK